MLHASNTSATTHPRRGICSGISGSGIVLVMSAADWETRELESASRERLLVEIGLLKGMDINSLKKQVLDLQLELLAARDFAMGAALRAGEAQAQVQVGRVAFLSKHIDQIYNSTTWKLGRIMMLPVRIIKKLIGKSA